MMSMIHQGELSQEEIIAEMINQGVLPVDVTDLGRLPVSIGNKEKSAPLTQMEFEREEVSGNRLKQLESMRARHPLPMRDRKHPMMSVDITDPALADSEYIDYDNSLEDEVQQGCD